jgi:hypothetical protein
VKLRNTLAPSRPQKNNNFTASGKVTDRRTESQGYINEAVLFVS